VASLLSEHSDCKVHVAGGMLRGRDSALEGDGTVAFLKQFKVDFSILSTVGIDADGTLRDRDMREAPVAQAMVEQARESWLVADMSKFTTSELAAVGHLKLLKRVFTDALPPAPYPAMLLEWGVGLTIAG
jgi:DeoR family glycerol-3-phosphate regulon repressor